MTKIKFTTSASGSRKGFFVEVSNNSKERQYIKVDGLQDPNFDEWDKKRQLFIGANTGANNSILDGIKTRLTEIIEKNPEIPPKKVIELYQKGLTIIEPLTFGQFVEQRIHEWKQIKSGNYRLYEALRNVLLGIDKKYNISYPKPSYNNIALFNTPISEINNSHFREFITYIENVRDNKRRRQLLANFKAVVKTAFMRNLCPQPITEASGKQYVDRDIINNLDAITLANIAQTGVSCISTATMSNFERFDLSVLKRSNCSSRNAQLMEIYRDTVLLLYYTLSRPIDVINFRERNITKDNCIVYIPTKLKGRVNPNRQNNSVVKIPICKEAMRIIDKYKGQSKQGYLLPLPCNDIPYNDKNLNDYHERYKREQKGIGRINAFLKKIAPYLDIDFEAKHLTMYVFRHSAITHAINKGENVAYVAKMAGTSIEIVDKHYFNAQYFTLKATSIN